MRTFIIIGIANTPRGYEAKIKKAERAYLKEKQNTNKGININLTFNLKG